jgi:lipoprotein-anchoring transpeptidase ErfK/SrfK
MNGSENPRAVGRLAWLLVIVPLLPIVVGFVLTSSPVSAENQNGYQPTAPPAAPSRLTPTPPTQSGTTVAVLTRGVVMRDAPAGRPIGKLGVRTEFGSPEAMWVVAQQPGWLGVVSSVAGNGRVGWVPAGAAGLATVDWELKVSLSARQLTVLEDGSVVQRYPVAIGVPGAPTPTGRFAVTDRLNTGDPTGPYGCCILALTAHSPHAIQGWNGGTRIAIHSTPDASSIGHPASHGCVRVTLAAGSWLLSHIPLGTPTLIET